MKEVVPQIITIIIGACYQLLGAVGLYLAIFAIAKKQYFGKSEGILDFDRRPDQIKSIQDQETAQYLKDQLIDSHYIVLKRKKIAFYAAVIGFVLMTAISAYLTVYSTANRWIDLPYKIGMFINSYIILDALYYQKRSKFLLLTLGINTNIFVLTAGSYIGIGEWWNAIGCFIIYIMMKIHGHALIKKIAEEKRIQDIKENGVEVGPFNIKVKITPYGNEPNSER